MSETVGAKRKRPPSFPHVHPSRARKFKKVWVEKAKIRSKWTAQREKEGLVEKAKLDIPHYDAEGDEEHASDSDKMSQETAPPPRDYSSRSKAEVPDFVSAKNLTDRGKPDGDNVRELMREAYSKSSLHTYKSDPLKKRAASGRKGEKGKGQPNMKLRMNAMLAKIKRDYA